MTALLLLVIIIISSIIITIIVIIIIIIQTDRDTFFCDCLLSLPYIPFLGKIQILIKTRHTDV